MTTWEPVIELAENVRAGKVKATDLVEKALTAIDSSKNFKTIIATTEHRARERAHKVDAGKQQGRLAGVPFIAKDNFLAFGAETTAASNMLKGFVSPYQATAIERLEAEGAICVAKANLDAFAHGSTTENSDFFTTKNPHDVTLVPGGSSGGSAATVVLDLVPFALGTDTGGSIRLPAAFCGCVGYKPTYGLVSRSGVVAMASSLDTVGPLARTVNDAALVLDVLAGQDWLDATTIDRDSVSYTDLDDSLKGKKIGIVHEYMGDSLDSQVRKNMKRAINALHQAGAVTEEVSLPSLPLALAVYYIICPAEVSSNLSRYDGQRYGYSAEDVKTLENSYGQSRSLGFGQEAKRRILIGTYVLSSGYYDAYYKKAQTVRTKIISEFEAAFDKYDFLIGPTAPTTAFKIGDESKRDPMNMYLTDIMTVAANLVGVPAISIPHSDQSELPTGVQLMAAQKADRALLGVARAIERII